MLLYKALNPDLTCLDYQYEVGKLHEFEGEVEMCRFGFHACRRAVDVFDYYPHLGSIVYVCEGNVVEYDLNKVVCDKIRLIRKIRPRELYSSVKPTYKWMPHGAIWDAEEVRALKYIIRTAKYIPQWCIEKILLNKEASDYLAWHRGDLRPYVLEKLARHKDRIVRLRLSERRDIPDYIHKILRGTI